MPSTGTFNSTFSVTAIGNRTDTSGTPVTDWSAEEARLAAYLYEPGYVEPTTAFKVQPPDTPGMAFKVGSGTAKTDVYVVEGTVAGQGNYLVRLDALSGNLALEAAHASLTRVDEIYLVILDNTYDSSGRALPKIGRRTGDAGSGNPGPDSDWTAYELLARITIPGGTTSITAGMISDQRQATSIKTGLYETQTNGLYYTKAETTSLLAGKSSTSHGHDPVASTMTGSNRIYVVADNGNNEQEIADHVEQYVKFSGIRVGNAAVRWTAFNGGHYFNLDIAGIWAITCTVKFKRVNNSPGERILRLKSNNYGGETVIAGNGAFSTGAPFTANVAYTGYFNAGDFIYAMVYTDADFNQFVEGDIGTCNIQLSLLRRCS